MASEAKRLRKVSLMIQKNKTAFFNATNNEWNMIKCVPVNGTYSSARGLHKNR